LDSERPRCSGRKHIAVGDSLRLSDSVSVRDPFYPSHPSRSQQTIAA
jgi:hypothetical protein